MVDVGNGQFLSGIPPVELTVERSLSQARVSRDIHTPIDLYILDAPPRDTHVHRLQGGLPRPTLVYLVRTTHRPRRGFSTIRSSYVMHNGNSVPQNVVNSYAHTAMVLS